MSIDPIDRATWQVQVERELRGRPLSKLVAHLPGGLSVQPLYTEADRPLGSSLPGAAPYTRGSAVWAPWHICPQHDDPRRTELRAAIADDLSNGAEGLWLRLDKRARGVGAAGEDGSPLYTEEDFAEALGDADLSMVHTRLDAGAAALPAAERWTALAGRQGTSLASTQLRFCMDPAAALLRDGCLPADFRDLWQQASSLIRACEADMPLARALSVSTGPVHHAGGDAPLELAVALAGVVEALRGLSPTLSAERIASQIELSVPMGRDIFLNIARLRALRTLWSHLLSHCGVATVPPPDVHAFSAPISLSQRDPWTNMLRVTTQTFSAIVGGAQRVTAASYDAALGQPSPQGRRLARNTPLILREESYLGQVTDPAGGSYYVESLTEQLITAAWARFQEIQGLGGLLEVARTGWLHEALSVSWSDRRAEIARRKWPVTGVSSFPSLEESAQHRFQGLSTAATEALGAPSLLEPTGPRVEPLPRQRDAAPFEALRDRADAVEPRPTVYLATLGVRADWTPRANFAANLFAAAGIDVIEDPGAVGDDPRAVATALAARCADSGAMAVCICGTDEDYASSAAAVARALGNARPILLAGRPDETLRAAGISLFIHMGCDALAALDTLLTRMGA